MEIVILLFACVALPDFTIVGAMKNQVARNPGKGKLYPFPIPEKSSVFLQKVIDGENAHNDVLYGTLASSEIDNRPSPTGTPMGSVEVYMTDENGRICNRDSERSFTYVWKIKDFENHGKDSLHNSAKTRYRCIIEREHGEKLYAFLKPGIFEVRRYAGRATVVFENQYGLPFIGKLHSGVDRSVGELLPLPKPLKNRKTNFAGSSSNPQKKLH